MMGRLSERRRSDRFALVTLAVSAAALAAAALLPVAPERGEADARFGVGLPTPPGAPLAGGFRRSSPFDLQHRPVDEAAVLPVETMAAPQPMPVSEAPVRVAGILVDGSVRKVIFQEGAGWQGVGSAIGSWTVSAIEPRRVVLRRGGETLVLRSADALLPR